MALAIAALVSRYIIPWLKSNLTAQQAETLVSAAEQIFGSSVGKAKSDYVAAQLAESGVKITPALESQIEAAVLNLPQPQSGLTAAQGEFIAKLAPAAQAEWRRGKILPSLTIAQAILESGWGKSGLAQKANNLFGIKTGSNWQGKTINSKTWEIIDGRRVDCIGEFRVYESWADSVRDHTDFLAGLSRYKKVVGETSYKNACQAVHEAGYATATDYSAALIKLIERYGLNQYDGVGGERIYTVRTGDSFWKIAQEQLGGGERYAELAAFNGLDPESVIVPGQTLRIPE
ncbi:MAG: glucosaminidase domain-containing protein [Oscillospiraceae bacterium]|nr:glucosaminidase domain-containing protein [Oscillospiraceae bacterium]